MSWDKCVGICTDGAHSMTGRLSGLVTRVQNLAPLAKWTHCMIHRESLASKKMPECLETVLKQAVQMINFIKARPLNAHLFSLLCQELGAEHEQLLFHTEVRWLSKGRVLHRLYELRSEVNMFLVMLVVIPCRHFRQVEFAEHIDARERCQHLAPFRQSQCICWQTGSLA